ncbi:hypothetical protein P152DRAFT_483766 [Eremomyces bilateralis CBS 781.70]|uniref:DUF6594 domain-containing protein n=1 Tax=Eremomyces bilateralis CBS 781.70 TaxID=1392243 RepID=A0A6G1FYC2_9PEZI|nr:uncharacterized protein P152DRAFT_483766 [Eremomyces bilateralis CBS 781.70]KAF1810691.1 hypothetical protein P152DRAFT_483766 [Eremomyces bilateralis CBS 781.70]
MGLAPLSSQGSHPFPDFSAARREAAFFMVNTPPEAIFPSRMEAVLEIVLRKSDEHLHAERELRRLERQPTDRHEMDVRQKQMEVESRLAVYLDWLHRAKRIMEMPQPLSLDHRELQNNIFKSVEGQQYMRWQSQDGWGSPDDRTGHRQDLVTIQGRSRESIWANLAVGPFLRWFNRLLGRRDVPYDENAVLLVSERVAVVLGGICLTGSITVLYNLDSMWFRLWCINVFTVIFAAVLCIISSEPASKTFVGLCGFAAVQVVFISGIEDTSS